MKERPILFSGPMVRAILDGRKTQTRRIVKPQPEYETTSTGVRWYRWRGTGMTDTGGIQKCLPPNSPYGQPGDRLWVRETWNYADRNGLSGLLFRADFSTGDADFKWRPSIFMPRWASRITLEVTGVRVERLQEISEEDAQAEGVERCTTHRVRYIALWNTINGAGSWESNPWVWVIEFKRVTE